MIVLKNTTKRAGRNDLCNCGSNLKYKKCCLKSNSFDKKHTSFNSKEIHRIQEGLKEKTNQLLEDNTAFINSEDHGLIKMSEVIVEFADEFLQKIDTMHRKRMVLELACVAWNIGVLAGESEELPNLDEMIDLMEIDNKETETKEVCKYMISVLANKKITEYSHINRVIINYKITEIGNELRIDVAYTASKDEVEQQNLGVVQK